jgi:uncharacterized membrane protein YoaK (UPF0700 family)
MFRNPGSNRSHRQNGVLAGYLALVAGYVNAVGFVVLGMFTSHATGNVGRLANELASHRFASAGGAFILVASFFGGAFAASLIIESSFVGRPARAYGAALAVEALLLSVFTVSGRFGTTVPDVPGLPLQAAVLSAAMGMQNSLVTRLSGAVVRTTHLTGVVTDLGIEAARWVRWWSGALGGAHERPSPPKTALLATIATSFTLGAVLGTTVAMMLGRAAAIAPSLALAAGAAYAFATRDATGSIPPARSR